MTTLFCCTIQGVFAKGLRQNNIGNSSLLIILNTRMPFKCHEKEQQHYKVVKNKQTKKLLLLNIGSNVLQACNIKANEVKKKKRNILGSHSLHLNK